MKTEQIVGTKYKVMEDGIGLSYGDVVTLIKASTSDVAMFRCEKDGFVMYIDLCRLSLQNT